MYHSVTRRPRRVKPTRRTGHPDTPFGFGLGMPEPTPGPPRPQRYVPLAVACPESYSPDPVEAAWAAQQFGYADEPDWDAMAQEARYRELYESGAVAGTRCSACWREGDRLTAGLCDSRTLAADMDFEAGTCLACNRKDDFIDATGLCPVCAIRAEQGAGKAPISEGGVMPRIHANEEISRKYAAAHFSDPRSRGARNECGRCKGRGCHGEVRVGVVWLPLCRGCFLEFIHSRPSRDNGDGKPFPEFRGAH